MKSAWNHNIEYHGFVLRSINGGCTRALDVGCGTGMLARELVPYFDEVVGIDFDAQVLPRPEGKSSAHPVTHSLADSYNNSKASFVAGDIMTYPFPLAHFDFITAVATLHHLPLEEALARFKDLLKPGGTLAIVGLYRASSVSDHGLAAVALPASHIKRGFRDWEEVQAPMQPPEETLRDIRAAAITLLPGVEVKRRFFFRYTLRWRKHL